MVFKLTNFNDFLYILMVESLFLVPVRPIFISSGIILTMDIIRRSKIYYCLRWFGLDTVLAVSSVHLVVMQDRWTLGTALGLGIVTSFFLYG